MPLVLAILTEGDSYGYAIIKRVSELSGGHLQWTDGMRYPVLHRLERQGHVAARWRVSDTGRRRKGSARPGRAHGSSSSGPSVSPRQYCSSIASISSSLSPK